jgi:hypothetical protein
MEGVIEQHMTVVKGKAMFYCGCGDDIVVAFRCKHGHEDSTYPPEPWRFDISHRNKKNTLTVDEPDALQIFDRMTKVSGRAYKTCNWPMGS